MDVVTAVPQLMLPVVSASILGKAQEKRVIEIRVHDLRDHAHDRHKLIDDTPYGGGSGMVLKPEPIFECIEGLLAERQYDDVIFLCPEGDVFDQREANALSMKKNLIILCGHYKGVDERVRLKLVTREYSLGPFVMTGGEIAALAMIDAIVRLIPGAVNDAESLLMDSFQDGMIGPPEYTRPENFRGMRVPEVLMSGNHHNVKKWRDAERMRRTEEYRARQLNKKL